MKIVTIVGARPQFIKAAVISRAIANFNKDVTSSSLLVTEVIHCKEAEYSPEYSLKEAQIA